MKLHIIYKLSVIILTSCLLPTTESFRILGIFLHHGISHFRFFQPLMKGLAEKGHEISILSYFPEKNPPANYTDFIIEGEILTNSIDLNLFNGLDRDSYLYKYMEFSGLADWGKEACEKLLSAPDLDKIMELHKNKPFDLVITEFFDTDCMLGVIHKMNVPFIGMSSCALMPWHFNRVGIPDTPSYIPNHFFHFSEKMTFSERVSNWLFTTGNKLLYRMVEINDNKLLREKYGDDMPDVREIAKKTSLILINQHYSLSGPKPLPPNVIEIAGIHIKDSKPIPNDLKTILDKATDGVILISWGSVIRADSLPDEKRNAFVLAAKQLAKQVVLWKWENETLENQPKNLHIRKWLPQKEILCHPNVKVFVSHGGLMGTTESVHCGVPMVVTPIYGDQFLNAAALVRRNIAIHLRYEDITVDTVTSSIRKLLGPEYQKNAKDVAYAFNTRENSPMDTAIWWVEHVIRMNGNQLGQTYAVNLNWFEYYSLDAILLVFGLVTGILISILMLLYLMWKCCCKSKSKQQKVKKQ